jgi:hypothetical protein
MIISAALPLYQPSCAVAFEQQFLSNFISSFARPCVGSFQHESWMSFLPVYIPRRPALQYSSRAAIMAHYSTLTNNLSIQRKAHEWYITSLRKQCLSLQRYASPSALTTPGPPTEEDIYTSMMLLYYELLVPTRTGSWATHLEGALQLLQLRGPENCQEGAAYHVLRALRFLSVPIFSSLCLFRSYLSTCHRANFTD